MNNSFTVRKSDILLFVILFLLLMPQPLKSNDFVNLVVYQGAIAFSILIIIFAVAKSRIDWFVSAVFVLRVVYSIVQLYSTKIARLPIAVDIHDSFVRIYTLIIISYLISIYGMRCIRVLSDLLIGFLYINLAMILLTKNFGSTDLQSYFLGYRYAFCPIVMLALAVSIALDYKRYNRSSYRSWLAIFVAVVTVTIEGPSTLLAGFMVFIISIYVIIFGKKVNINFYWILFISIIVLDILITILNSTGMFSWFITNVLHRDLSFTGRTEVWLSSIQAFLNGNIWIGNGSALAAGHAGWSWVWEAYYSEHNHYLGVLTNGGIICLLIECALYILLIHKMSHRCQTMENIVFAAAFFSILGMGIGTQIIPFSYMELLCLIAYKLEIAFHEDCL